MILAGRLQATATSGSSRVRFFRGLSIDRAVDVLTVGTDVGCGSAGEFCVAFEESEDLEGRELEAPKAQEWWQTVADSTIFSEFSIVFL